MKLQEIKLPHSLSTSLSPTFNLVVALRHHGCTFCRQALSDLGQYQKEIEKKGWKLILVHMSETEEFKTLAQRYLTPGPWEVYLDEQQEVYAALGLSRGSLYQVLGPQSLVQGMKGLLKGYGLGPLRGDGFQLSGMALSRGHQVERLFKSTHAAQALPLSEWLG